MKNNANKIINKKNHKILFEKIWFNKDLQRKIIEFTGPLVKKRCTICGRIIKYQILTFKIKKKYKKITDLQACKKTYVCCDECREIEKIDIKNIRCLIVILFTLITTFFLILIILMVT